MIGLLIIVILPFYFLLLEQEVSSGDEYNDIFIPKLHITLLKPCYDSSS